MNFKGIAAIGMGALVGGLMIASAQGKGTIKIVSQSPLSGGQSVLGEAVRNGAQLALDDFGKLVTSWRLNRTTIRPNRMSARPTPTA
jgi:hypothetical protein